MSDRTTVLESLAKLNVPHLVKAFNTATDPKAKKYGAWIDSKEMKSIVSTASRIGADAISASEWQAIQEIAKYDFLGPQAKTYFADLEKNWNTSHQAASSEAAGGSAVTLTHASSYKGDVLGMAPYKGECAAGVQQVFSEAGRSLGLTRTWVQGVKVRGNNVPAGTAIASFKDGKYWHHAAVFIRETSAGLEVWDQWAGQEWHKRTLRFDDKDTTDGSNNGNLFYVIEK